MKSKTFVVLLIAAGVLAALSLYRYGTEETSGERLMGKALLPDLPVNQVAKVVLSDAEHRVTLHKGKNVWEVAERDGYAADFDQLRETIVNLSRLKIGRSFAGSPESIERLSLNAPGTGQNGGAGKQLTLFDTAGGRLADVVLGKIRRTESGASGGQYVKRVGKDDVFLVDAGFPFLKTDPAQWLKKEVLDINAEEIESVTCFSGDQKAPVYALSRPGKGESATLAPIPEGRQADTSKIDQVFDALSPLTLEDVSKSEEEDRQPPDQTRLVYRLYDGREITLYPDSDGENTYTLRITARQAELQQTAEEPVDDAGAQVEGEAAPEEASSQSPGKASAESRSAQRIHEEVAPWIFTLKKWQFDSLITQPEHLLQPQNEADSDT